MSPAKPPSETEYEHELEETGDSAALLSAEQDDAPLEDTYSSDLPPRQATKERSFAAEVFFEIIPTIAIALVGQLLAGEVLAHMKKWQVFARVPELFILVPMLLNLKGNLEMNLAARLSTAANTGALDRPGPRKDILVGNFVLIQLQALIVSFFAGLTSFLLGLLDKQEASPDRGSYFECALVLCVSMLAASFSSAALGALMCCIVVLSRKFHLNPDNFAAPLAASLSDLITLSVLGLLSAALITYMSTLVSTVVIVLLIVVSIAYFTFARRNEYVRNLIWSGWIPLIFAVAVSSVTGIVLQDNVNDKGFGLLSPVLTGLAGNFGAIFVSRISTALHAGRKEKYMRVAIALSAIAIPSLIGVGIFAWATNQSPKNAAFLVWLFVTICLTVFSSLGLAYGITLLLWKYHYDPDTIALPFLSSIVDLLGQLFLVLTFKLGL